MKLHKYILPTYSFKVYKTINANPDFSTFYLAGGTSLALQLGHRTSIDLDFFSPKEFPASITESIKDYSFDVVLLNKNSVELVVDRTKVTFMYFAFPLTREVKMVDGLRLVDPVDVGLMKLLALQGRTTKKDIIDLYFIDQEILSLEELFEIFEKAYPKESFNAYQNYKQLFDFEKLSLDPMPNMFKNIEFDECLALVTAKVTKHLRGILDISK